MNLRYLFAIAIFILLKNESAQSQVYHLTTTNKPYVDLSGGTPLVSTIWDDPVLAIPIGFDFQYYDNTLQNLYIPSNYRFVTLIDDTTAAIINQLVLFGADLIDRGYNEGNHLSPITYKTTGSPGSRVLTVEWKNAGFFGEAFEFGTFDDFVNFQLKLYEADGNIEYAFGPSSVTHAAQDYGATGPIVGIVESVDVLNDVSLGEIILLAGNPSNPTIVDQYEETHLSGTIPAGTSYTFSSVATAVHDINKQGEESFYFPNPARDFLTLKVQLQNEVIPPVFIINDMGQIVSMDVQPEKIELTNLPVGIYQLRFQTSAGQVVQRILLQD